MATQPIENIEAVLGRFQAWAGTRNAVELRPGIREIPYEEALASGRYRWKGVGANSAKKAAAKPQPARVSAASVNAEADRKQRTAKPVRGRERVREHAKTAREAKAGTAARVVPDTRGGGNRCAARKAATPGKNRAAEPAFREALTTAIRPAEVVARPLDLTRQAAISIRLASSERALIKTRAAEAGITASAYVRQCAVEVEQLREQVRSAIAAVERGVALPASVSAPASAPAPAPGLLGRMRRRFFRGSAPAPASRV